MPNRGGKEVFVDCCTQRDYLAPEGARRCLDAQTVTGNLKHLMAYARWQRVPTISCVDFHRPDAMRGVPAPYCVLGTPGQKKLGFTLLPDHFFVESDNCLCVPMDILEHHQQIILTKGHRDPFTNPKLDRLLTELPVDRFVIFGVSLEQSLRLLALGLLLRGREVVVVHDACGSWNPEAGEMTLRRVAAKGGMIATTSTWLATMVAQAKAAANGRRRRRSVA